MKKKLLQWFQFRSIQSNIMFTVSFMMLISIIGVVVTSYKFSSDAVENNSREFTYQLIQQVNTNIESYITYMENVSQMVMNNYNMREYLSKKNSDIQLQDEISEQLGALVNARKDISTAIIFGKNGRVIFNKKYKKINPYINIEEQSWYKKALQAKGKPVISFSHVQNVIENEYRWVVSLSREIIDTNESEKLGVLLIDLNYSSITDLCSRIKLGKRGYVFIVDQEGNIIYHPQQQLIYSDLKSELIHEVMNAKGISFVQGTGSQSKMYTIEKSRYTGWSIVGVTYLDELVSNKKETQGYYFLGGIGLLFVGVLLSILISSRISRPIKNLELSMMEVEKGNFDIQVESNRPDELGQLSRAFNIMTYQIKHLMKQNIKEQELKRKSELKALQAQINPHFLYNTLDSIIWMAESKKSEEVVLMTSALAKLFRLSISKGEEMIPLASEIEHIKSYLTIQKMRYKDKLDFKIQVDDAILESKVLKIILQPLVENAIYHGIKNISRAGFIGIYGMKSQGKILLQVKDNGIGMTEEEMKSVFLKKESGLVKGSGVGVRNVNERIKLYFGDEFGLFFESAEGKGTVVNIWLPLLEEEVEL